MTDRWRLLRASRLNQIQQNKLLRLTADNKMEDDLKRVAASANAQADAFLGGLEALKAENSKRPKKKRKRFALIHGVYSDEFVLPWESPAELEQLHQELKEEWQPIGRSQEEAVVDLTRWNWLKRRATKMPQLALYRDPFSLGLLNSGKTNWHDIIDHQPMTCQIATDALHCTASALRALEALSGIDKSATLCEVVHRRRLFIRSRRPAEWPDTGLGC